MPHAIQMPATRLDCFAAIVAGLRPEPIVALHAAPPPPDYDRRAAISTRISNEFSAPGSAFTPCDPRDASPPCEDVGAPRALAHAENVNATFMRGAPLPSDDDRHAVPSQRVSNELNGGGGIDDTPRAANDISAAPRGVTPVEDFDPSSTGDGPSPSDDDRRAVDSNRILNELTGGGEGVDDALRVVTPPLDDIATLFTDVPRQPSKKRSRQRLNDSEKIETAFAAIEGVRVVSKLLAAATKPAASNSDPVVRRIAECISYSVEKLESCASALNLACTNTTAKKCASLAHRKLEGEERRHHEREQLLVRGIGEVSVLSVV